MHLGKWAPWVRRRSSPDFATLGLSQQRSFFGTVGFSVYILIYMLLLLLLPLLLLLLLNCFQN